MIVFVLLGSFARADAQSRRSTVRESAPPCLVVFLARVHQLAMLGTPNVLDEHEVGQGSEVSHETDPRPGRHPMTSHVEGAPYERLAKGLSHGRRSLSPGDCYCNSVASRASRGRELAITKEASDCCLGTHSSWKRGARVFKNASMGS